GIASRANAGDGDAGKVTVKADDLVIDGGGRVDGALISGATLADGDAGSVDVTATTLTIRGGGGIGSSTFGNGDGGEVKVEADELTIDGDGVSGFTGISGNINGGLAGDAGEITVVADRLTIRNDGEIISNAFFGSGDAGTIVVRAGQLVIDGANAPGFTGISTGTQTTGDAGTVTVEADRLVIDGANAAIDSDTEAGSTGNAGAISVSADTVEIAGGSQVASSANGRGTAGDVVVGAADRLSVDRGSITTESAFGGGGEIRLLVGDVIDLRDSAVTTSVAGGADPTAGNITIDPTILIIDGSRIQANAPAGSGGTVTIVADNILVPGGDFQALLDRKDISATGGDPTRAGTIAVSAPEVDLSGGLVVVEGAFIDTAPLRERCGSRRDIGVSSFTGVGRGGLPPSPDGPLAGAYASGLGEPGVALLLEERDEELFAEEHSVERAIGPVLAGLVPCHGAL
ncbi:MAG TPA: hypothetical protein VLE23_04705, partial [Geminicoccaceae bacterium]|nr:hypothetical protein [Geminicoccaceae bacterium]